MRNESWFWKRILFNLELWRKFWKSQAHPGKHLNPPISIHCTRYMALLSTGFKSNALLEILISSQITMNINDEKTYGTEDCKWASEIIWPDSRDLQMRSLPCRWVNWLAHGTVGIRAAMGIGPRFPASSDSWGYSNQILKMGFSQSVSPTWRNSQMARSL